MFAKWNSQYFAPTHSHCQIAFSTHGRPSKARTLVCVLWHHGCAVAFCPHLQVDSDGDGDAPPVRGPPRQA